MRFESGYERRHARVELIPLIDVVFLLLVFFIYAMLTMSVKRGLDVALPEAGSSLIHKEEFITISVTERGTIHVEERVTPLGNLSYRVKGLLDVKGKKKVLIQGDRKADLGRIIQVLDVLTGAGIKEVTIETREPEE